MVDRPGLTASRPPPAPMAAVVGRIALISLDKRAPGWHLTPLNRKAEDGAGGRSRRARVLGRRGRGSRSERADRRQGLAGSLGRAGPPTSGDDPPLVSGRTDGEPIGGL